MIRRLYFILLAFTAFVSCDSEKFNQCQVLEALLSIDRINSDLRLTEVPIGRIRIFDRSGKFKDTKCNYMHYSIKYIETIPLDFNTGRFVDLAILHTEIDKRSIDLEIFYALSGQGDVYPNLFMGSISLIKKGTEVEVVSTVIDNIQ